MVTVYQTSHFTEPQERDLRLSAGTQEEVITKAYKKAYPSGLRPSQVRRLTGSRWPLTSVRRAINTLTEEGVLIKTDRTGEGEYGRPERYWVYKSDQVKQAELGL